MSKTMKEISAEWRALRQEIGTFVNYLNGKEAQFVDMEAVYEKGYNAGFDEG